MMTIPNILSFFRIIAAPVMWVLIYFEFEIAFTWLLTVAFFTDLVDGFIARKLKQVTTLGSMLDSYGDSLTILSGVIGLLQFRFEFFEEHKLIVIVVVSVHLLQLVLSLWRYGKPSSFHTWSAKAGALAIGMFILITLHFQFIPWLFYFSMVILTIDAVEECILVFILPDWKNDVKGIFWVLKEKK